jgi:hypothetical protein
MLRVNPPALGGPDFFQCNVLAPSAGYGGPAGSGFGGGHGEVPTDPARTTAKPVCRLMVVPFQRFTDFLLVGVYAGANDNGSLLDNMGLAALTFHYEGSVLTVPHPTWQLITDANGRERSYFGWWCWLKHNGVHGEARLYVEAVPNDAAMQSRVIGPYSFFPKATLHDYSVTVTPSQPVIAGQRYQSIGAALSYLSGVSAQAPLVTVTETGTYDIAALVSTYTPESWCQITATVPITIGKSSYTTDIASQIRCKFDGLHFKGSNITFDMRYTGWIRSESRAYWFDGVNFTNSVGSRYALWRKGLRIYSLVGGNNTTGQAWFTECHSEYVPEVGALANLCRGNTWTKGYGDIHGDTACCVGNTVDDWDSTIGWFVDVDAMSVTYTGAQSTATLAISGVSDTTRVITATWGANTQTFTVSDTEAYYTAGTNYDVADVVNWVNTTLAGLDAGWSATLIDDTRRASSLSGPGLKGQSLSATSVKNTTLTLVTCFDQHGDFYQQRTGQIDENVIVADNKVVNFRGQGIFIAPPSGNSYDYLIYNNCFFHATAETQYAENDATFCQLTRGVHSHVTIAHNTHANQGYLFRVISGYNPDVFCLVANNSFRTMSWSSTTPDTDLVIANNHIHGGNSDISGATGTTIGGDADSLFVDAANGNFAPAGDLLTNLVVPVVKYDAARVARGPLAAKGALA